MCSFYRLVLVFGESVANIKKLGVIIHLGGMMAVKGKGLSCPHCCKTRSFMGNSSALLLLLPGVKISCRNMKDFNIFKWQEIDKCIHYHENPQALRYSEFFNTDSGEKKFSSLCTLSNEWASLINKENFACVYGVMILSLRCMIVVGGGE